MTQVQRAPRDGVIRGYSMRTERHRYTMWDDGHAGEELYDYSSDPRELKNLAKTHESDALKADLRSRMEKIIASRRA